MPLTQWWENPHAADIRRSATWDPLRASQTNSWIYFNTTEDLCQNLSSSGFEHPNDSNTKRRLVKLDGLKEINNVSEFSIIVDAKVRLPWQCRMVALSN